jgi:hypothetical protein
MALDNMIPTVWSARMLANLDMNFVYGNAINRDYQADAIYGNIINIFKMSEVTIGDYVKNTDISAPEVLSADKLTITIDQQKYFNIYIDSIDEAQTKPNIMDAAMGRTAYAMALKVDSFIAGLYTGASKKIGTAAAPVTPTVTDIYGYLTTAAAFLDQANVPQSGRYMIMNPAGVKLLKDSGEMLSDTPTGDIVRTFGMFGGAGVVPNGYKGRIANFDIWMSNHVPTEDAATSIWTAGHNMGISMVDSLNSIEGYVPEKRFGEAVKGLYVYGAALTQPGAVVPIYTTIG